MDATQITVAIIGLLGVIISVFATARTTQNKIDTENQVQNQKIDQLNVNIERVKGELTEKIDANHQLTETKFAHMNDNLERMKEDIMSHNHYAKLFSETVPVVQEKQSVANKRIDDLEREVRELRKDMEAYHRKVS